MIELYCGDCLEIMPTLPDHCADMILADLPYGTTACKWDTVIPFEPLWAQYKRIIKPRGAIVLFGSQPFTSALVMSNAEWFKYSWVWRKTRPSGFVHAKNAPLKTHEDIAVFSSGAINHATCTNNRMVYYPQGLEPFGKETYRPHRDTKFTQIIGHRPSHKNTIYQEFTNYPVSVIEFPNPNDDSPHPTKKPVALCEYLIRTYTNEGEAVLDNVMGSGTSLVACVNTGRNGIGIELDASYFAIAQRRIAEAQQQIVLPIMEAAR